MRFVRQFRNGQAGTAKVEYAMVLGAVLAALLLRASTGKCARDLMTDPSTKVSSEMLIKSAVTIMFEHRVSSLPVVEDGQLKGILTTTDLSLALQCAIQLLESQTTPRADGADRAPMEVSFPDPEASLETQEPSVAMA